jgi:hypothetical protein
MPLMTSIATPTFKAVKDSPRAAHQQVLVDAAVVGEIWREQVHVTVSSLTQPRRTSLKWRWFARKQGATTTLGKGTRMAMLFGSGFKSKSEAVDQLLAEEITKAPV